MPEPKLTRLRTAFLGVILFAAATLDVRQALAAGWTAINNGLPSLSVGVVGLAVDPSAPGTVYAQTTGNIGGIATSGLFKTTDGAATWRQLGSIESVRCFVIDPFKSSTLYAGTDQGVAKSTNGGESWTDASTNLPSGTIVRLVIDPITPGTLYALSNSPVSGPGQTGPVTTLFKTTDSGASWRAIDTGLAGNAYVTVLAISRSNPPAVYIFAPTPFVPPGNPQPSGGLLRSVDGGETWKTLNLASPNASFLFVNSLAIGPGKPSTLYATTNSGLLKSSDGGDSWAPLRSDMPQGVSIASITIDSADPTAVYASANIFSQTGPRGALFRSRDEGEHWTELDTGSPQFAFINALAVDPTSPDRIYIGSSGFLNAGPAPGGILKTADGGLTWDSANNGLLNYDVRTVAVAPDTGTMFAGGYGGTFQSTDQGDTWNATGATAYTGSLAIGPGGVIYAITGRSNGCNSSESLLLKSSDGGANWTTSASPLNTGCILNPLFNSGYRPPLLIDPSDPNRLYLGESDSQDGYSALLATTDGGANWRAPWDWFNGLRGAVLAVALAPAVPATLYAGIDDGITVFGSAFPAPDSSGLFKSTDGGNTWSRTALTQIAVKFIAVDRSNPRTLYAAVERHYSQPNGFQGVVKSIDAGATWTAINNGLERLIGTRLISATALVTDRSNPQVLYLGASGAGVFQSSDGGATWHSLNDGLTSLQIRDLAVGNSGSLYAVTAGGLFRYSGQ
jgi:photosystem II stability/assembly factor-like uncharacterized protein